jgi:alanine racemase
MDDLLYMEIDLRKFATNIREIIKSSERELIPVIKSNAYGIGDLEIARTIDNLGLKLVAVVDCREAIRLAKENFSFEILILNSIQESEFQYLNLYPSLIISVNSYDDAVRIGKYHLNRDLKVHIQIDTGMNRSGFKNLQEYLDTLQLLKSKKLVLEGIYTHFTDSDYYQKQIEVFLPYLEHHSYKIIHTCASYTYPLSDFGTHIRVGVALYGFEKDDLKQIIKIACKPLIINKVKKGETVGYDRIFVAEEDQLIAVLPIGYYNGFRRSLSGFPLLANNNRYVSVGKVCMNHLFVQVDESITTDTEFIITSEELPVDLMAEYLGTVPHEILCMFRINNIRYLK